MSWLMNYMRVWRVLILALFITAFIGPWVFDSVFVPAEYACSSPWIRLEGDFCGLPMSGFWMLSWYSLGIFSVLAGLFTATTPIIEVGRMALISVVMVIFILPLFSMLTLILKRDHHICQVIHIVACGLAGLLVLLTILIDASEKHIALWGIWMYRVVVIAALALEVAVLARKKKYTQTLMTTY